jgi:outer membrane protein OmpA-like peptidoglycan-associated protein
MKKYMFLTALLVGAATTVFAQTTETVTETKKEPVKKETSVELEKGSFWSNTFVSVGLGGQVLFGDHEKQMKFGDRIAPALDIAVGKWLTPYVGVRLMYSGWALNGAQQDWTVPGTIGNDPTMHLVPQDIKFFNLHGDLMVNVSNIFFGYNPERIWNCSPYLDMGWVRKYTGNQSHEFAGILGIHNTFRLSEAWDLNLDVRAAAMNDATDGEVGGRSEEGILSATIGATYKFKPRGWKQKIVSVPNEAELALMREKMNALRLENEELKNMKPDTIQNVELQLKEVVAPCMVVFQINKADLSQDARVNLGMFAENVKKADKGIIYTITGYADAGTGNEEINRSLSKRRAEAVYDCLVNEFGISPEQLKVDYKGGVENMFYDNPEMSRATIVTITYNPPKK